jgi:predicted alpha/beta-fold hydrolase
MGKCAPGVPHLLILPGLEAKVTAKYAHGLLAEARKLGWSGDLMMFRSCDGEVNTSRRFYHSGETTDLDYVVQALIAGCPDLRLVICGVSLGGNVLLKWLGEKRMEVPSAVERVAAVSVPFDLEAGARYMERGFARVYVGHFLQTLKAKALEKLKLFPDLCDQEALLRAKTFWEFDQVLTGPIHGFTGARDYYTRSSSIRFLASICVPSLLMSAWNDPFLPFYVLEKVSKIALDNPLLSIEFSDFGGHVGWVDGQPWAQGYYMERRVVEWLSGGV